MINAAVWLVFAVSLTALVYSHVVYPMLMALASLKKAAPPAGGEWPSVSLIIPAHNESLVIDAKLQNTLSIDYPAEKWEVIVASDGSSDDTVAQARAYEDRGVQVLDLKPRRGKASILNDAVAACHGEIICLCDANVMFRPDAVRTMAAHFVDPTIGAVTGDVRLASEQSDFGEGEGRYYKLERAVQLGESQIGSVVCVDGGMYALRRELYRTLAADTVLDDFTTTMNVIRQGSRVIYDPAAIADENGTPYWQDEYRRRIRTTMGAVQSLKRGYWPPPLRPIVFWQYLSHKLLRWLGPLWLGAVLVTSCLLWSTGPLMRALVIGQGAAYSMAALAAVSEPLRRTRLGGIVFYFAMSHVAIAHGWMRGLVGNPSGIWQRTARTPLSSDAPATTSSSSQVQSSEPGRRAPHGGSGQNGFTGHRDGERTSSAVLPQ
ncbi:MAG: glycosyltransferase family 2 protein [Planctomycetaceae bacterium]